MTAKSTLQTLQRLIDKLSLSDEHECTIICVAISNILTELKSWAETSANAKRNHPHAGSSALYISEMLAPLNSIAGLYDYGHDKEQCIALLNSDIRKLAGVHCFDVQM
jgi:hypothetical protein